jgi:N-acetylglucosamine-6-phosphate deacetylase
VDDRLGRLAPDFRADLVALNTEDVLVRATWVCGKPYAEERNKK